MKVCLVNALFYPFSGGVEKHMLELSRELVRQGVDVTIVTPGSRAPRRTRRWTALRCTEFPA